MFFGEPGPWFNEMHMDGDKTTIFHDVDGSVSEYPGAFLVKEDNWLLRHPDCIDVPDWKAAICSGNFAQVTLMVLLSPNMVVFIRIILIYIHFLRHASKTNISLIFLFLIV